MATKKKTDELEKQESAEQKTVQTEGNTENADLVDRDTDAQSKDEESTLFSVGELAMHYRVPSWQLAALLKLLDVEDDKLLTRDAFAKGLDRLGTRKMGTR